MILAIRNGHYDVAAALVEKGANINAADAAGRTPLYMSVDMQYAMALRVYLVQVGLATDGQPDA